MKSVIIPASDLLSFTQWLRSHQHTLIRARPFRKDLEDCYHILYL